MADPMNASERTVRGAVQRLARALRPERIILFGSHASGTARSGSDIDLLLVGNWAGDQEQWLRRAQQLVARSFPVIDLALCTPEELTNGDGGRRLFLQSIVEAGRVVYERPLTLPVER
jgi:predicted nucleotidyltransferase